ncbi:MAG TPA: dihydroxyacetone kinase subunit DhaL [Candidatus Limnocylindrales bacterium]|jgi:dihydroxyacetone kinase, phosphoprotein-dependent, L subunit|nr:dihydroxyacetone kinase subunit DhaL [Candidatus Limnocylindrales bacterium]
MPLDQAGQLSYDDVAGWIRHFAAVIAENKQYLTELDSAIGDADHGINMDRGFQAVLPKLDSQPSGDIGAAFKTVGSTLISTVGGASGPLYGTFFLQLGIATTGRSSIDLAQWLTGLAAATAAIQRLGKAEPGDKTMLDALIPARDALSRALSDGASPAKALDDTVGAAEEGMRATIPLVARKGRASYLGERSAGHQDPGATSLYLLLRAAADQWQIQSPGG